ncbi:MAG: ubiquinone biosynthesis regulatory protein kinase UbiB, partial [Castellaniella sp.]
LPQIPRLVYTRLNHPDPGPAMRAELERLRRAQDRSNALLAVLCGILAAGLAVAVWALTRGGGF